MATLRIIEAGHCTHLGCIAARHGGWSKQPFPARAYFIENQGGRWLIDTGYATHFREQTRCGWASLYPAVTPVHFSAEQSAAAQLAALGYGPGDLSGIVISHFHADHIAGLKDFPGVPLLCSKRAWTAIRSLRGMAALRRGFVAGLIPSDFEERIGWIDDFPVTRLSPELHPFQSASVLPGGAGEVLIVDLPGHAAGHIGAFVSTAAGWKLLAADAAWVPENYRELHLPSALTFGLLDDLGAYRNTLKKLHELDRARQVPILLSHG